MFPFHTLESTLEGYKNGPDTSPFPAFCAWRILANLGTCRRFLVVFVLYMSFSTNFSIILGFYCCILLFAG